MPCCWRVRDKLSHGGADPRVSNYEPRCCRNGAPWHRQDHCAPRPRTKFIWCGYLWTWIGNQRTLSPYTAQAGAQGTGERTVKATYDAKTDTLTIILKADARVVESDEEKPGVIRWRQRTRWRRSTTWPNRGVVQPNYRCHPRPRSVARRAWTNRTNSCLGTGQPQAAVQRAA